MVSPYFFGQTSVYRTPHLFLSYVSRIWMNSSSSNCSIHLVCQTWLLFSYKTRLAKTVCLEMVCQLFVCPRSIVKYTRASFVQLRIFHRASRRKDWGKQTLVPTLTFPSGEREVECGRLLLPVLFSLALTTVSCPQSIDEGARYLQRQLVPPNNNMCFRCVAHQNIAKLTKLFECEHCHSILTKPGHL